MFTEHDLMSLGFEYIDYGDDVPYEAYKYKGVEVWNWNNDHWIITILDQNRIDVEYRTLEHLNEFFKAIGIPLNLKEK